MQPSDSQFAGLICLVNLEMLHIHRQSAYLFGRDRLVADIPIEHPSCSKQHAVIHCAPPSFPEIPSHNILDRHIKEKDEYGATKGIVKYASNAFLVRSRPHPS
jgi:hypothetical protein